MSPPLCCVYFRLKLRPSARALETYRREGGERGERPKFISAGRTNDIERDSTKNKITQIKQKQANKQLHQQNKNNNDGGAGKKRMGEARGEKGEPEGQKTNKPRLRTPERSQRLIRVGVGAIVGCSRRLARLSRLGGVGLGLLARSQVLAVPVRRVGDCEIADLA